jgi:hypothetical protein
VTPTLLLTIDAFNGGKGNILFYGHLDKQPWMEGWEAPRGATNPVVKLKLNIYIEFELSLFIITIMSLYSCL